MAAEQRDEKKPRPGNAEGRPRRRGHGDGSIFRRSDGRWVSSVDYGWVDGRRVRKDLYGKTRAEVREKLAREQQRRHDGLAPAPERLTVGQFLDDWVRDVVKPHARPNTYKAYEAKVRVHLKPALGRIRLTRLSPQHVQAYMASAAEAGRSPKTVRDGRGILSVALNQAMRWGLVTRNVATLTNPPTVEERQIEPLDIERAGKFLTVIRGDRLEALFRVALSLGIREGEALGLRWQDVDLDRRVVRIRMQVQWNPATHRLELVEVKSPKSRRMINLPDFAVRAFERHRARQAAERLAAGPAWVDWEGAGLAFTTETGGPIHARNLLRVFHKLRAEAGLPELRFHDARHTCATLLLAQGVPERVVMEILGHANLAMTMRYAHVLPPLRRDAADKLDAALRDADGDDDAADEVRPA